MQLTIHDSRLGVVASDDDDQELQNLFAEIIQFITSVGAQGAPQRWPCAAVLIPHIEDVDIVSSWEGP